MSENGPPRAGRGNGAQRQNPKRQRTSAMYERKRAVTACQACRFRKTKCDNIRPKCGFCSRNGAECVYSKPGDAVDYSTYDPASLAILDRINHVVTLLENRPATAGEVYANAETSPGVAAHQVSQGPIISAATLPEEDGLLLLESPEFLSNLMGCEATMQWPIFEGTLPDVRSFVLECSEDEIFAQTSDNRERRKPLGRGVQEDDFIGLSKRFLAYTHIKNPILDIPAFKAMVRSAAEDGPGWDGPSCLVLIACALGCLAVPFHNEPGFDGSPESTRSSSSVQIDLDTASSYFLAAKKRLGLLQPSLLYVQCLFLCGVYEMYRLRPLDAWVHFSRANVDLRNILWLRSRSEGGRLITPDMRESRRLEQRLFWSCVKTEYELRCEIPLLPSGIATFEYPDALPSPPTELTSPTAETRHFDMSENEIIPEEERSWFYYLAEISHRRMMNRAVVTLGRSGPQGWLDDISSLASQSAEFLEQIDIWYSHIPSQIDPRNPDLASDELTLYVKNRETSSREWIHRPFLYYVVHRPADDPRFALALPLAERCLALCVENLFRTSGYHRHHGTWYIARMCATRVLMLVAAVRCGRITMPGGWRDAVEVARRIVGRWAGEAQDLRRVYVILESVIASVEEY